MEIWKDIQGFKGRYQVSDMGRVKSLPRRVSFGSQERVTPECVLKPVTMNGYEMVNLCVGNKPRTQLVHRLVAATFIPNPCGLPDVDHIDFDRANNKVTNLRWAAHRCNLEHSRQAGRMICGEDSHHATITEDDVRRIRALDGVMPRADVAAMYGITANHVYRIVARKKWKHVA